MLWKASSFRSARFLSPSCSISSSSGTIMQMKITASNIFFIAIYHRGDRFEVRHFSEPGSFENRRRRNYRRRNLGHYLFAAPEESTAQFQPVVCAHGVHRIYVVYGHHDPRRRGSADESV